MDNTQAADILNSLLDLETRCVLSTLPDAEVWLNDGDDARAQPSIEKMVADTKEHIIRLTDMILDLRASPAPVRYDAQAGELHYLSLGTILPRIAAWKRRLVDAYEVASTQLASHPRAAELVGGILQRHHQHLAQLDELSALRQADGQHGSA